MKLKFKLYGATAITAVLMICSGLASADVGSDTAQLQSRWAEVNYQLEDDAQVDAFEVLIAKAEEVTTENPNSAEAWTWSGIIRSTYAGAKGGLGALSAAKQAKKDLEKAMDLDPATLEGSTYATLGTLYFSVPGWPIGFGDEEKAEELLLQALELSPTSVDNNYFYSTFLISEKRYDEARTYLAKAQQAPARPDRPIADAGRKEEILQALADIRGK